MVGFRAKKTCQIPPQVLNKTDFRTLEIGDDTFVPWWQNDLQHWQKGWIDVGYHLSLCD